MDPADCGLLVRVEWGEAEKIERVFAKGTQQ